MKYIVTESQAELLSVRRIILDAYDETVRYVLEHPNWKKRDWTTFRKTFFNVLMDEVHPFITHKFGEDWDYDKIISTLERVYYDDVFEFWDSIREK